MEEKGASPGYNIRYLSTLVVGVHSALLRWGVQDLLDHRLQAYKVVIRDWVELLVTLCSIHRA